MDRQAVTLTIPPDAGHVALLRTLVGAFAGRDGFTVEQIDDIKMAVEEAAVQLLRATSGDQIHCGVLRTADGAEFRLSAALPEGTTVVDESSFSWMILRALSDELAVERDAHGTSVVLRKKRMVDAGEDSA